MQFKSPSSLAPGTYSDTLTIEACEDSACQQQIEGSPAKITVKYVVSEGAGTAPQLSRIGPNVVTAGGASFELVLTGSNFDRMSTVQWNGVMVPTTYLTSSVVVADISAANIAEGGQAVVTVANLDPTGTTVSNALTFTISTSRSRPR